MVKKLSLFRSGVGSRIIVALSQATDDGLSLRELARSVGTTDSAVQRALEPLRGGGFVRIRGGARTRYVPASDHPVAAEALRLAMHELPRDRLAATLVRANRDVEFASLNGDVLLVVFSEGSDPRRQVALRRAIAGAPGTRLRLEALLHGDVPDRGLADPAFRERVDRGRTLKGRVDRTFPERQRHGDFERARRLGRPHPSLPRLSRRTLQRLAREHALTRVSLFGSAVRADFRPGSDVDVLVRRRPGPRTSLSDVARLQRDLEGLLDRDVDIVDEDRVEPHMRPVIEREKVVIYGRP